MPWRIALFARFDAIRGIDAVHITDPAGYDLAIFEVWGWGGANHATLPIDARIAANEIALYREFCFAALPLLSLRARLVGRLVFPLDVFPADGVGPERATGR